MVSGESPAVARRRVRMALRDLRRGRELTQGQVADALDWSLSKVQRIESGEVSVSTTDLRALLEYYGIHDAKRIERLVDAAKVSRRQRWWTAPEYREHLTPGMMQLLQFEAEATAIRTFQSTIVPGVVQTPAYANWLLTFWGDELSEEDRTVRLDVRMRRRAQVLDRPDPPDYLVILDESVLYREVGGPSVMADQLRALLALMEQYPMIVRVIPFAEAAPIAMLGPFTVLDLGDEVDAVLYRESHLVDEVVHVSAQVQRHRGIFEQLWSCSYDHDASKRLIEARAAAMVSALDRRRPSG